MGATNASERPLPMVIRLRVERTEPLAGTAAAEDGTELGFEGWMELLRVVAALLGSPERPSAGEQPQPTAE
ncbi:hypothetical protein [Allosalinactinospora lopnorensis]|uniref:hypothetical protein n=1 Tax=Allosalinactinospora lopnorensis TaxID=1352348 RepID=UPI000623C066|nr:hypothetical protein [Allosalinactinospora lopnorensis]